MVWQKFSTAFDSLTNKLIAEIHLITTHNNNKKAPNIGRFSLINIHSYRSFWDKTCLEIISLPVDIRKKSNV